MSIRYHYQILTDGRLPLWRHGRAWLGAWHWEWTVLCHPKLGIGLHKGGYGDNQIVFRLSLILFTIYVGREFRRAFADREFTIYWFEGSLWFKLWVDDDWIRDRPWWRNAFCWHVREWFTGWPRHHLEEGEPVNVLIPMPEGCYEATAKPYTRTWTYRFGYKIERRGWDFDIPDGGIPFEGKGENSWDCGTDGLCGISATGSLEEGIGKVVTSVLKERSRYGYRGPGPRLARVSV